MGQEKLGEEAWKSRILTDSPKNSETANQRAKKGKRKYSGKIFEKKAIKKSFITVDSS
jgi:hypothetical protein